MFKIKRKFIISICLSAVLLSGCGQSKNTSVPALSVASTSDGQKNSGSSAQSSSSASSSVQSSEAGSIPEQSSAGNDDPVPPESSTSEPASVPDPPVIETQTVVYNLDPKNSCTITFDGTSITVKGVYGDLFQGVAEGYPAMDIQSSVENGILTCVLTPKSTYYDRNIGSINILDKGQNHNVVNIDLSKDVPMFPDTASIVQNNKIVLNNVVNASDARVAQFITMDGSRDRVSEILDEVKELSDEICLGIDNDYDKLRAISRWVSDNIYYDHPIYNSGGPQYCLSLEYTLSHRSSICGGYANLTSALCAAQGIRCLNISGTALLNGVCFMQSSAGLFHEWNIAEIDGRMIIVDSGWNSGNNLYADGSLTSKPPIYKYFDIGEDVFALNHQAQSVEYRDYWSLI